MNSPARSLERNAGGWLRRSWDGRSGPMGRVVNFMLLPVEVFYRGAVLIRNRCYDLGILPEVEGDIPVISVGNLAVGGTGKTPVAAWLVTKLVGMGHRPALVTRGYGHDEVLLHKELNPCVPTLVQKSRVRGVAMAVGEGAGVVVLDDGFQHRAAARSVDIVLLSAEQGVGGPLLPRGRFREPVSALARADAIVVTRKVAGPDDARALGRAAQAVAPQAVFGQIHLQSDVWIRLSDVWTGLDEPQADVLAGPPAGDLLAVSGIAEPDAFHEMVRSKASGAVEFMAFPDHHSFTDSDVRRIVERARGRPVITTEKDAVKLRVFLKEMPGTYVLRLRVEWDFGEDAVMELVRRALDKSPGSSETLSSPNRVSGDGP